MAAAAALEPPPDWRDSEEGVAWADALDALDVATAERRGLDALNALHRAEALVSTVPPVEERLTCAFTLCILTPACHSPVIYWLRPDAMHASGAAPYAAVRLSLLIPCADRCCKLVPVAGCPCRLCVCS